ncbi:MAG: hypothetical protein AABY01_00115, partial [Nanoarchaeota archaeon]
MERGDPVQVAEALLQFGVQEQDIFNSFLQRIQFGAEHMKLVHRIKDAAKKNNREELNKAIVSLNEGLLRFDAIARFATQEQEVHNAEVALLDRADSLLHQELMDAQQALAKGEFGPAAKRRLSTYLLDTDEAMKELLQERTLEKHVDYAVSELRNHARTQSGLLAMERELLNKLAYGDMNAADDLIVIAGKLQYDVLLEKEKVVLPLNLVLKKKIDMESVLENTVKKRKGSRITMADIQEDV